MEAWAIVLIVILGIVILITGLYFMSLWTKCDRMDKFKLFEDKYIAHRGLFENGSDHPENSLAAFKRAVEEDFGIELDVQLTKDDKLVVFHDGDLKRICGINKKVIDCTYEELLKYNLLDSEEKIPLFDDFIKLVKKDTPLVIEVKPEGNAFNTCRELVKRLDNYEGTYCIESFDPRVVHWFKVNRPEILRGLLSDNFGRKKRHMNPIEWMMANLLFNSYAKPDFISFNHKYKNMFSYKLARKLFNFENAAWTIKNQEQLDNAKDVFNIMIFDSFIPERDKRDE